MIKYRTAFDADGNIIKIEQVTNKHRKINKYYCIGCGDEMKAALGQKKQHYFSHKNNCNCSSETYYHNLAKRILKHRFDSSSLFVVKYFVQNACPKATLCKLKDHHNWESCSSVVLKSINLKDYYNTCEEEVGYKGFKADLILTHTDYPNRDPLFLEVAVSHNCSPEKINSNIRIIEIKVQNEVDAYREIIENEGEYLKESNIIKSREEDLPPIRFYNFKRKSYDEGTNQLSLFYLFQDKDGRCYATCKSKVISCSEINSVHINNSLLEVTLEEEDIPEGYEFDLYDLGMALASERGFDVKSCIICKNFKFFNSRTQRILHPSICMKIKDSQLPKNIKFQIAYKCRHYCHYNYMAKNIVGYFKYIPYHVWVKNENNT